MLKWFCAAPAIADMLLFATPTARAAASDAKYVEGEVLVTFKTPASLESARKLAQTHLLQVVKHYAWLSEHRQRGYFLLRSRTANTTDLIAKLKSEASIEV